MYQAWQHVTVLDAEVVMGTKHIGGNHRGVAAAILLKVGPARDATVTITPPFLVHSLLSRLSSEIPVVDVNHSLGVGVAKVGLMRRAIVHLAYMLG